MVFFCCDGCGESMKKAKVDAHAAKCRQCYAVSCVDCSQSFPGDDYRTHTSCISEAERYEKTIYRGSRKLDESGTGHRQHQTQTQQKGKKLSPQEAWNQTVQHAAEMAPPSLKNYTDQLANLENVPRKEKQFRNFIVNSLKLKGPHAEKVKGEIWALLMKAKEETKPEQHSPADEKKVEVPAPDPLTETKPNISESDDEHPKSADTDIPSEKALTKVIKNVLKKAPNKQLKFKALRKQIQSSFAINVDKNGKKKWKKLLQGCVDANPKKFIVDGKSVTLSK